MSAPTATRMRGCSSASAGGGAGKAEGVERESGRGGAGKEAFRVAFAGVEAGVLVGRRERRKGRVVMGAGCTTPRRAIHGESARRTGTSRTGGCTHASHRRGILRRSTLTRRAGGIQVPFAMASATMRPRERMTMAEETLRRRMSVARKVYTGEEAGRVR
ncbi:hypothetical protein B0H12DRAFT_1156121 [Mycena haematopus]|nr:hypothetical protein B0H12DRAFT_1156121 [Mycena haematopus]